MSSVKDSALDTGADNGTKNDTDDMFREEVGTDKELNRVQLLKLTTKQLAKMAQPYSKKTLKVLEKTAKATLCDLILNKGDKKATSEKTHSRESRTKSDTENFIDTAVSMLDVIKRARDDEPLNATSKDIFVKQAVVYADEKVSNDEMNVDKANTALFIISTGALLFDGLIGFKNAPTLFNKIKNKFTGAGKKEVKADDSK